MAKGSPVRRMTEAQRILHGFCIQKVPTQCYLEKIDTNPELGFHICTLPRAHMGPHLCWCDACWDWLDGQLFVQVAMSRVYAIPHEYVR